jgi:hypothetical protein
VRTWNYGNIGEAAHQNDLVRRHTTMPTMPKGSQNVGEQMDPMQQIEERIRKLPVNNL